MITRKADKGVFNFIVVIFLVIALIVAAFVITKPFSYQRSQAATLVKYIIYDDKLADSWLEWSSSNATVSLGIRNSIYSGSRAISFTATRTSGELYFHTNSTFSTSPYSYLHLAVMGRKAGQKYSVALVDNNDRNVGNSVPLANFGGDPPLNEWRVYNIPLSALPAVNKNINGIRVRLISASGTPSLFLDEIELDGSSSNVTPTTYPNATITLTPVPTTRFSPTPRPTVTPTPKPTYVPTTGPLPTHIPPGSWWKPTSNIPIHYQWQIGTTFNPSTDFLPGVTVYDIDGFDNTKTTVEAIHSRGYIAICYIDVGGWEAGRPDSSSFPGSSNPSNSTCNETTDVLGAKMQGWPEYYVNVKSQIVRQIMANRIQMCKDKGFDAVEPDVTDAWDNNNGCGITPANQLDYNRFLANTAHSKGMSIGLKGDIGQANDLQPYFDWTLNEQCAEYNECPLLNPFLLVNKAVFQVEYNVSTSSFCPNANADHRNAMRRDIDLTKSGTRQVCIPDSQNSW